MSLCDYDLSGYVLIFVIYIFCNLNIFLSTVFALMMTTAAPASPVPLMPSAYSAEPNEYGRVANLLVSQLEGLSYLFVVTEEGYQLKVSSISLLWGEYMGQVMWGQFLPP